MAKSQAIFPQAAGTLQENGKSTTSVKSKGTGEDGSRSVADEGAGFAASALGGPTLRSEKRNEETTCEGGTLEESREGKIRGEVQLGQASGPNNEGGSCLRNDLLMGRTSGPNEEGGSFVGLGKKIIEIGEGSGPKQMYDELDHEVIPTDVGRMKSSRASSSFTHSVMLHGQESKANTPTGRRESAELVSLRQSLPQILAAALKEALREGGIGWGSQVRERSLSPGGEKIDTRQNNGMSNIDRQGSSQGQEIPDEDNGWWQKCAEMADAVSPPAKGAIGGSQEMTPNLSTRSSARIARKRGV